MNFKRELDTSVFDQPIIKKTKLLLNLDSILYNNNYISIEDDNENKENIINININNSSNSFNNKNNSNTINKKKPSLKIDLNGFKNNNFGNTNIKISNNIINIENNFNLKQSEKEEIESYRYTCSKVSESLYVGGVEFSKNIANLQSLGITHIVNVSSNSKENNYKGNFKYLGIEIRDFQNENIAKYFGKFIRFSKEAKKENGVIFVHCSYGISRSVALCCLWMMYNNRRLGFRDALNKIKKVRPLAEPNISFQADLLQWEFKRRKRFIYYTKKHLKRVFDIKKNSTKKRTKKIRRFIKMKVKKTIKTTSNSNNSKKTTFTTIPNSSSFCDTILTPRK